MLLKDTLHAVHAEVRERIDTQPTETPDELRFEELVFTEIFGRYMAERDITLESQLCHFSAMVGGRPLRLSGYAISEELDRLDSW